MAYEMVMPYHLHMPSYFLETFTEYPYIATSRNANVRAYMQSPSLLLPAIQTIHKITNARTGYHKQSHEIKSPLNFC